MALVTGAARRVGAAVVLHLARQGYDVALACHRSTAEAHALRRRVETLGRRAVVLVADLARPDCARRLHRAFREHFRRLDLLVNNAAIYRPTPLARLDSRDFDAHLAVNARAALLLIRQFAPLLAGRFDPADPASAGRVVNLLDAHVLGQHRRGYLAYNASKAALLEITRSCALELAPAVTVNAIAPGVVAWDRNSAGAERRRYLQRVPLARPGSPADVAAGILFLARQAPYMTGQVLVLDGGRLLT